MAERILAGRRGGILSWCLYDWAMSAYNTVIGTFIFSVYFTRAVADSEVAGTAQWGRAVALSGLAVAVLSPVLGAIADRGGRRKPWLALFTALTVAGTALLWFVKPDPSSVMLALVLVGLTNVTFELANVFYNAMLPGLAPPGHTGRVSGWGWGLGYVGGLGCLVISLFGLVQTETPLFGLLGTGEQANVRATALLVALWYGVFSLPLFLVTPDQAGTGVSIGAAVRDGIKALIETLRQIRRYGNVARWLVASALYRDGLNTLFAFGGIYAAGTFGMGFDQIVMFAIALNVTSAAGAFGFAWIDDWIGPKRTILGCLVGLIGFGIPLLFAESQQAFWILALGLGVFVGPAQAAGRTMMAKLAPSGMETEMFGLYALSGRAVSFVGPLLLAWATESFQSQRAGMATIVLLLLLGFVLLFAVREERGT
ncbi:MFS transporter [Skermanella stibiiresistens SB22]|uniref:MFS transporter n=1 Tax=Skermanella stibiiresistens SB22 TaxID=1385369 RepID=W9HCG0_9PROT|nr:MFS transporter [Skermanella stibiiresistens]EWY42392.1 MFS transporter [Skermanella stibiiresistens SB22]